MGISKTAAYGLEQISDALYSMPPFTLGLPSQDALSNYYPGSERITRGEIATVSAAMQRHAIEPENTRLRKSKTGDCSSNFDILQASAERDDHPVELDAGDSRLNIRIVRGDHREEMKHICTALGAAQKFAANDDQKRYLLKCIESFTTGNMDAYRKAQIDWVRDGSPKVENLLGFIETYRDPLGAMAEWEGIVYINDVTETRKLAELTVRATEFIQTLPWAVPGINDGKGPLEKTCFEAPHFAISHGQYSDTLSCATTLKFVSTSFLLMLCLRSGKLAKRGIR